MPASRQFSSFGLGFGLGGEAGDEEMGALVVFAVEGVGEVWFGGERRSEGGSWLDLITTMQKRGEVGFGRVGPMGLAFLHKVHWGSCWTRAAFALGLKATLPIDFHDYRTPSYCWP